MNINNGHSENKDFKRTAGQMSMLDEMNLTMVQIITARINVGTSGGVPGVPIKPFHDPDHKDNVY